MWTSALAGAVAFVMVGSSTVSTNGIGISTAAASEIVVTYGHIARLKSALRLTPDQIRHWRPVETALRNLAQHGARRSSDEPGMFERVRSRAVDYASYSAARGRLAYLAQPLISSLNEDQKRDGMNVIRAMGMASLL